MNTIRAIRGLLEKLGAEVEDYRRKSPGPSQITRIAEKQDAYSCGLKNLEGSIKWLQETLTTGYA
jgi:hypothetical protein